MPGPSDSDYKAQLGALLRRRDPEALHLFLRRSASTYGDESQVAEVEERSHAEMEELMHRMILSRPDLADLHAESRAWLLKRDPSAVVGPPPHDRRSGGQPNRPCGPLVRRQRPGRG